MHLSRWFLLAVAAGLLAAPAISQSELIRGSELGKWAQGPGGEVEVNVFSVKLRNHGGKLQRYKAGSWQDTDVGEMERVIMAIQAQDEGKVASLSDLRSWLDSAKLGDRLSVGSPVSEKDASG
ncbi:MAG: hypothetical protein AB1758_17140 [Candidatus Eremiobacterota bacterium]